MACRLLGQAVVFTFGTVWQRCTTCRRKVNGRVAARRHKQSDCERITATWAFKTDVGTRPKVAPRAVATRDRHIRHVLVALTSGTRTEATAAGV